MSFCSVTVRAASTSSSVSRLCSPNSPKQPEPQASKRLTATAIRPRNKPSGITGASPGDLGSHLRIYDQ